jgi:hypothetical protein
MMVGIRTVWIRHKHHHVLISEALTSSVTIDTGFTQHAAAWLDADIYAERALSRTPYEKTSTSRSCATIIGQCT